MMYETTMTLVTTHYQNGKLYEDYSINLKDEKEGIYRKWHDNGVLIEDSEWKNGQRNGRCRKYNNKGLLCFDAYHLNGELHGEQIIYNTNKNTALRTYYFGGKEVPKEFWEEYKHLKGKEVGEVLTSIELYLGGLL